MSERIKYPVSIQYVSFGAGDPMQYAIVDGNGYPIQWPVIVAETPPNYERALQGVCGAGCIIQGG